MNIWSNRRGVLHTMLIYRDLIIWIGIQKHGIILHLLHNIFIDYQISAQSCCVSF